MNKANSDMNIFTMEFGKMKISTDKHFQKVYEEFNELNNANNDYAYGKIETDIHPAEKEEDKKNYVMKLSIWYKPL